MSKYFGADILNVGSGQCQHCAARVMRLLVNDGSHRSWRTVVPENGKYIPHECRSAETAIANPPEAA